MHQRVNTASLVAHTIKSLPARWEIRVQFLGLEDPLEKKMVTTPVFLPGKIPWIEESINLLLLNSLVRLSTDSSKLTLHFK